MVCRIKLITRYVLYGRRTDAVPTILEFFLVRRFHFSRIGYSGKMSSFITLIFNVFKDRSLGLVCHCRSGSADAATLRQTILQQNWRTRSRFGRHRHVFDVFHRINSLHYAGNFLSIVFL